MEVHLRPETVSRLQELAAKTGRAPDDLVEDAMAAYLQELAQVREMLDGRYDDIQSGRVKPIDGEEGFATCGARAKNDAPAVHERFCSPPGGIQRPKTSTKSGNMLRRIASTQPTAYARDLRSNRRTRTLSPPRP